MLLNAKKLAFLGLLLAITVLLIILSGVLEFNTIFLLAGASLLCRNGNQRMWERG